MAVPGYSISDLWDALKKCKEIVDAFRSGYRNAAGILSEFNDELERVKQSLEFQAVLYDKTGRKYPGSDAFKHKLEECAGFVSERDDLLKRHHGKESFKGILQTVVSAFEKDLPVLRQALAYNRQEFLNWKIDLLLELVLARAEQPVAAAASQPTIFSYLRQDGDQIQRDVNNLVSIIYAHNRLQAIGHLPTASYSQAHRGPENLSEDELAAQRRDARLWTTIASICQHGNVPDDYRPPNFSLQTLSRHLSASRQRAVIQNSSGTARYLNDSPMIFPRTASVEILIPFSQKQAPYRLRAYGYIFVGAQFIFLDANGEPMYEHRLGPRSRPFTRRHLTTDGAEKSVVEFRERQDVSILRSTGTQGPRLLTNGEAQFPVHDMMQQDETFKVFPQYSFIGPEREKHYRQFQSDVRGLTLAHEFHADSLKSKYSKGGNDADQVRVKLWKSGNDSRKTLLSSVAQFTNREMLWEWPLRWFEKPQTKGKLAVRLQFKAPPAENPSPNASPSTGARGLFGRPRSWLSRQSSNGTTISSVQEGSGASSIRSVNTTQGSKNYPPNEWLEQIQWLEFSFDSTSDRDAFVQAITDLMTAIEEHVEDVSGRFSRLTLPELPSVHPSSSPQVSQNIPPSLPSESLFDSPEISSFVNSPASLDVSSAGTNRNTPGNSADLSPAPSSSLDNQSSRDTRNLAEHDMLSAVGALAPAATPATFLRSASHPSESEPIYRPARPQTLLRPND